MTDVFVTGSFDDLRSREVRFLEEAAKHGPLRVLLWDDAAVEAETGRPPKFPLAERLYVVRAIRYVADVSVTDLAAGRDALSLSDGPGPAMWVVNAESDSAGKRDFARSAGLEYRVLPQVDDVAGFPPGPEEVVINPGRRRIIVTGCYDWLHSGHIRFFEEVSRLGDLYVVVGHDVNVRLLKGEGHPLFPQELRRYMTGSVRCVTQALISSGMGWLDAEPEIARIRPHAYAVNEDGDKPEKRAFCEANGIEYVVLERTPKEGLPRRASTDLRGY